MQGYICPIFNAATQFTNQGVVLAGGKIQVYLAGTTTATDTWTTSALAVKNTNPIVLDSAGRLPNPIWLQAGIAYKFVLQDSTGASVGIPYDNVSGTNDPTVASTLWTPTNITPTYVSATSFTMPGDVTSILQVGRRIQATVTAGTAYGTIITSSYSGITLITTVTSTMDSTTLDSGLSVVNVGTLPSVNTPVPVVPGLTQSLQRQTYIAYTTAGTATAFTLTPTPVATANLANYEFEATFNQAGGIAPTMSVSGLAPLPLKYRDAFGNLQAASDIPANYTTKMWCDGTNWVINHPMLAQVQSLGATVAANAMTITYGPAALDFRSATAGSGAVTSVAFPAGTSVVIPLNATLGAVNATAARFAVLGLSTGEIAVANTAGGLSFDESGVISTTAITAAATSASVYYSTTARASVAYRLIGYVDNTQATAGTYATAPSAIQGMGSPVAQRLGLSNTSNVQTFTSSGTWVKPGFGTWALIEVWGAGGAGGGNGGAGGGGGNYAQRLVPVASLGVTEAATVGLGGTGTGGNGNPGGNSSLGSWLSARGGGGGIGAGSVGGGGGAAAVAQAGAYGGGAGGSGATPPIDGYTGGGGGGGGTTGANSHYGGAGGGSGALAGGTSIFGGNGGAGNGAGVGVAGSAPGGGGGSGSGTNLGGAGGNGQVKVTVF